MRIDDEKALEFVLFLAEVAAKDYRRDKRILRKGGTPYQIEQAQIDMEIIEKFFCESLLLAVINVDGKAIIDQLKNEEVEPKVTVTRRREQGQWSEYYYKNRDKILERQRKRKEKLIAQGICVMCAKRKSEKNDKYCKPCGDKFRTGRKRKRCSK